MKYGKIFAKNWTGILFLHFDVDEINSEHKF